MTSLIELTPEEHQRIIKAMHLAAESTLFPEWEFHTIFGIDRTTLRFIASRWPDVDYQSVNVCCAVLNTLNNLVGYPHRKARLVQETLSMDARDLVELYRRVAPLFGRHSEGDHYSSFIA